MTQPVKFTTITRRILYPGTRGGTRRSMIGKLVYSCPFHIGGEQYCTPIQLFSYLTANKRCSESSTLTQEI